MPISAERTAQVSVIIPTLNAGGLLTELLDKLNRQSVPPAEIIVIDSESDDGTPERAELAGAQVLKICRRDFDHGGARNHAASYAKGNILLFMTQDAEPRNERLIERLVFSLSGQGKPEGPFPEAAAGEAVIAYARQLPRQNAGLLERLAREFNYPPDSCKKSIQHLEELGLKTFFCSNVCCAIRKDIFEEMGKFQEPVIFNEDLFMAAKCVLNGYAIAYCADAEVIHSHQYTIRQQFKRYFDNGVSMRMNRWMTGYSAVGKAGSGLVSYQMKGLVALNQYRLLPRLVLESAAKLFGYKLGLHYRRLPKALVRQISMHKLIWSNLDKSSKPDSEDPFMNQSV